MHRITLYLQTKRAVDDREREKRETNLQKKVTDLSTQVSRLEKRINVVRSENEALVSTCLNDFFHSFLLQI